MLSRIKDAAAQEVIPQSRFGDEQRKEFPDEWQEATTEESDQYITEGGE